MPSLSAHASLNIVKLLNIGESGTGKTGQLVSLARAGYRLHILDYDNGLDILANILRKECPEALDNVEYETVRDDIYLLNGLPMIKSPTKAFAEAGKILSRWGADKWNHGDVLVLDTLSTFSDAAFNHALFMGQRLNKRPQQADYGTMADTVLLFLQMICDDAMDFNVIVNSHIRYLGGDEETQLKMRGLPNAKGQQIPNNVSRLFNTVVLSKTQGTGPATKRVISTNPEGVIEVKTSNPLTVKPTYPVETGLAQLFADITGKPGPGLSAKGKEAPASVPVPTA